MADETLSLNVEGGIAHLQFIRGSEFNTMNKAFWPEIVAVFDEIDDDSAARVVVLSAQGKHFTSGLDLNDFGAGLIGTEGEPARKAEAMRRSVSSGNRPPIRVQSPSPGFSILITSAPIRAS